MPAALARWNKGSLSLVGVRLVLKSILLVRIAACAVPLSMMRNS